MTKRSGKFTNKSTVGILVLIILVGVAVGLFIKHHNKFSSENIKSTPKQSEQSSQAANNSSASNSSQENIPSKQTTVGSQRGTLLTPFGNFVSNHSPGGGRPTTEESVCNTTPGASCYIKFTKSDGTIKTLSAQTADSNGTVIWNWDVKDAGFTSGSWQITAIATLSGQSKSNNDAIPLNIGS